MAVNLTPDEVADVERELDQAQAALVWLRDKRAGFVSSLEKVEFAIGANERAILRMERLLGNDAA